MTCNDCPVDREWCNHESKGKPMAFESCSTRTKYNALTRIRTLCGPYKMNLHDVRAIDKIVMELYVV